jgi:hypothetical protein
MKGPAATYRQPSLFDVEPEKPSEKAPEKPPPRLAEKLPERSQPEKPQVLPSKPKPISAGVFDLIDTVRSPIITFGWSWSDMIAPKMRAIVPFSRMKALIEGEQLASYAECSIYISSRAFEAPLDTDWTEIFVHVTCTVMETFFQEDFWESLGGLKKLNEWQTTQLTGLRRHIYDKRREELKKRLKQPRTPADQPTERAANAEATQPQKSVF